MRFNNIIEIIGYKHPFSWLLSTINSKPEEEIYRLYADYTLETVLFEGNEQKLVDFFNKKYDNLSDLEKALYNIK